MTLESKNSATYTLEDATFDELISSGMATGLVASPTYPEDIVINEAYSLEARTSASFTNESKS